MAKNPQKPARQPSRFVQVVKVLAKTARDDKGALAWSILAFLGLLAIGLLVANIVSPGQAVGSILWGVTGGLAGLLAAMIILSQRAQAVILAGYEGQPGATGAVLQQALRRGWRFSEMPVHVSPKTQEMVFRAVGPGGVVLIGEGSSKARVQQITEDERRKVSRIAPGVTTHVFYVIPNDPDAVKLAKLGPKILKLKRALNRSEVSVVAKRLESIGLNIPVPKGIDPRNMRMPRR
jgi:hypothetical protein